MLDEVGAREANRNSTQIGVQEQSCQSPDNNLIPSRTYNAYKEFRVLIWTSSRVTLYALILPYTLLYVPQKTKGG